MYVTANSMYVYSHTLCIFSHPMYILTPYPPATLLGAVTLPTTALSHVGTHVCSRSESQKVLCILLQYSHILCVGTSSVGTSYFGTSSVGTFSVGTPYVGTSQLYVAGQKVLCILHGGQDALSYTSLCAKEALLIRLYSPLPIRHSTTHKALSREMTFNEKTC